LLLSTRESLLVAIYYITGYFDTDGSSKLSVLTVCCNAVSVSKVSEQIKWMEVRSETLLFLEKSQQLEVDKN